MAIRALIFLGGLTALLLAGVAGVHWTGGASRIEGRVAGAVADAIDAADVAWVTAETAGRRVRLSGEAPDEEAMARAMAALATLHDPLFGPVAALETDLTLPPAQPPPAPPVIPEAHPGSEEAPTEQSADEKALIERLILAAEAAESARAETFAVCRAESARILAESPILFESGRSEIGPGARATLDRLAVVLDACPTIEIIVEGHSDDSGAKARNIRLSAERAQAVATYLGARMTSGAAISAAGYGDSRPVAPNDTPENRARNRRIEITLSLRSGE